MAAPKVMSGARATVFITKEGQGPKLVGIFNNISYRTAYDAAPAYILGRYSAASIDYTAAELVTIDANGWRVVDHGPFVDIGVPKLQDLVNFGDLLFVIHDRATDKPIAQITGVKPTNMSSSIASRALTEVSVSFVGLLFSDESGSQDEPTGPESATLP